MFYRLFRWLNGVALHWFYSSIQASGLKNIPAQGPVIIAASHHNALVDALIAVWVIPRRLTLTAKATLMENVILARLLSLVGVVPLRRASDELKKRGGSLDFSRNADAFRSLLDVLENAGAILVFPEGKSHSEPSLAPLKSGVSRIALEARNTRHISGVQIVPLGLNFEDKGNPGTAILAQAAGPILVDDLQDPTVEELTTLLSKELAAVSLKQPVPAIDPGSIRRGNMKNVVSPLAIWGELTHRWIINHARELAVRRSRTPDDPAMLTIIYSLVFILTSYVIQFGLLYFFLGPAWATVIMATLPIGAYWAAYSSHRTAPG
jgi:1-acyl-sn-glycerol-3-phosphate acyltransferase